MERDEYESSCCGNCLHWRDAPLPYNHCVRLNRRPGWGELEFMPAEADESCHLHEPLDEGEP